MAEEMVMLIVFSLETGTAKASTETNPWTFAFLLEIRLSIVFSLCFQLKVNLNAFLQLNRLY